MPNSATYGTLTEIDKPSLDQDVNAAHARLRSHQHSLDSINSRVDGTERRVDRLENRMDDQSAVLSELSSTTRATQTEIRTQGATMHRAAERVETVLDRLNKHIDTEKDMEHENTVRYEKLHRTIIRGVTVLAVVAALLMALTREHGLLEPLMKIMGG